MAKLKFSENKRYQVVLARSVKVGVFKYSRQETDMSGKLVLKIIEQEGEDVITSAKSI